MELDSNRYKLEKIETWATESIFSVKNRTLPNTSWWTHRFRIMRTCFSITCDAIFTLKSLTKCNVCYACDCTCRVRRACVINIPDYHHYTDIHTYVQTRTHKVCRLRASDLLYTCELLYVDINVHIYIRVFVFCIYKCVNINVYSKWHIYTRRCRRHARARIEKLITKWENRETESEVDRPHRRDGSISWAQLALYTYT